MQPLRFKTVEFAVKAKPGDIKLKVGALSSLPVQGAFSPIFLQNCVLY